MEKKGFGLWDLAGALVCVVLLLVVFRMAYRLFRAACILVGILVLLRIGAAFLCGENVKGLLESLFRWHK